MAEHIRKAGAAFSRRSKEKPDDMKISSEQRELRKHPERRPAIMSELIRRRFEDVLKSSDSDESDEKKELDEKKKVQFNIDNVQRELVKRYRERELDGMKKSSEKQRNVMTPVLGIQERGELDDKKKSSEPDYIAVCDRAISHEDISEMANKISSSFATRINIELSDCELKSDHLKRLCKEAKVRKMNITTLVISYMNIINELLEGICSLIKKFGVFKLSLEYDDLDDESVTVLQKYLREKEVKGVTNLDISYNKNISKVGYKLLGEIMREFEILSLKATDCNLDDDKLENLIVGLDGCKLKELDIGRNTKLTTRGFETIAHFVAEKGLQSLKMSGCDLTRENIDVLHKSLLPGLLLEELDVSYNPTIEPDTSLGSVVVKCGITKLNMAGCKLNEDHLIHIRDLTNDYEINTVNMRDNSTIGEGIIEVAKLVKECKLKELNICDCMFTAEDLKLFIEALDGAKLNCLHLGDRVREPDEGYLDEVYKILLNFHVLHLRFAKLSGAHRSNLRKYSESHPVKIVLTLGSEKETMEAAYSVRHFP